MVVFTYQDYCKYKASVFTTYTSVKENVTEAPYTVCSMEDTKNTTAYRVPIKDIHDKLYRDFLNDDVRNDLLKKFEEGDDASMKYAWDYVKEDIARERAKDREAGRIAGKIEGKREGFVDAVREFVTKMLENGESIDKIKLYSGYSKSQIEKIRKELNLNASV